MIRFRILSAVISIAVTITSFTTYTTAQNKEYRFGGLPDGAYPASRLSLDKDGILYGTTALGGLAGCEDYGSCGTVFKLVHHDDGSWSKEILYRFTGGLDGGIPGYTLARDAQGNLYGTTFMGGGSKLCIGSCGVVFELSPNQDGSWKESTLYAFQGEVDGGEPNYGVIFDSFGNLYGTTDNGGTCNPGCAGVVFELTQGPDGTWRDTTLYSFTGGTDGYNPQAVIFGPDGNLYGTTTYSGGVCCGTVFELETKPGGTWNYQTLYSFTGGADGGYATSGVVFDTFNNLYGETATGGDLSCVPGGCGVIYQLKRSPSGSWREKVVHRFHWYDGDEPSGGLWLDTAGVLYGTTVGAGNIPACQAFNGCGTIFKISPAPDGSAKFNVIHKFKDKDGLSPVAGVIVDTFGNIYGTAAQGGNPACAPWGCGVVFMLSPE